MSGWRLVSDLACSAAFLQLPVGLVISSQQWARWADRWAQRGPRAALGLALVNAAITIILAIGSLELNEPGYFFFALFSAAFALGYLYQIERAKRFIASATGTPANDSQGHDLPDTPTTIDRIIATATQDQEWEQVSPETIAWMRGDITGSAKRRLPDAESSAHVAR